MYKLIPKYFLYKRKQQCLGFFQKHLNFLKKKGKRVTDLRRKVEYEYSFFHFQFSIQNENSTGRTVAACEIRLSYLSWILGHISHPLLWLNMQQLASLNLVTPKKLYAWLWSNLVSQDSSQLVHILSIVGLCFYGLRFLGGIQLRLPQPRDEKLIPSRQHLRQQFGICRPSLYVLSKILDSSALTFCL